MKIMKFDEQKIVEQRNINKNKQLASLLVKNIIFQNVVKSFRQDWTIPENGFENEDECNNYKRILEEELRSAAIVNKDDTCKINHRVYKGEVLRCLYDIDIPEEPSIFIDVYRIAIDKIISDLSLMDNMVGFLSRYLLFNSFPGDEYFLSLPSVNIDIDPSTGLSTGLSIHINDQTSLQEIKLIWKKVMTQQVRFGAMSIMSEKNISWNDNSYKRKPQVKKIVNLERDSEIHRLKTSGLTCTEIALEMKKKGYKGISYDYVSKLIGRLIKKTQGKSSVNN